MYTEAVKKSLADSLNINILAMAGRLSCTANNTVVIDSTSCGGQIIAHSACINTPAWREIADNADSHRNLLQGKKYANARLNMSVQRYLGRVMII